MSIRQVLKKAGYDLDIIYQYTEHFGDTWNDAYDLVPAGETVVGGEFFWRGAHGFNECSPFETPHIVPKNDIHRKLKPGLDKVRVK